MALEANEEVRWDPASKRNYILNTYVPHRPSFPLPLLSFLKLTPPPPHPNQCHW